MIIILVIAGAIFGSLLDSDFGFIFGGILGYLVGAVISLQKKLDVLQKDIKQLVISRPEKNAADMPATRSYSAVTTPDVKAPINASLTGLAAEARLATEELSREQIPASMTVPVAPDLSRQQPDSRDTWHQQANVSGVNAVETPVIIQYLRNFFSGPNVLVRVGIIVLFFGVAFLLKYAAERSHFSIELKLAGVALASIVMLVLGWRLRTRNQDYALVLQGGAIGVLYLTIFTALRIYHVLPPGLTLAILAAVGVFSAIISILQNARSLAILGICGGFLAPILTSTGGGSHVMLFSYYALLNAGIFGMAWFKAWRPLNLLGFFFTFVIGIIWGVTKYNVNDFSTSEPFLILFFLFYVAIAVLYASRQAPNLKSYVDGTLVFGTPLIVTGLQAGMMQQAAMLKIFEYGMAVSAAVLSLFYLVVAKILFDRKRDSMRLLVESFLALGIVFATLAIPFALDARWTSASWALEGAAILWMGIRQNRMLPRLSGLLLQLAAGIAFMLDFSYPANPIPILNSSYIGGVIISFAGLFCAWYLQRNKSSIKEYEYAASFALFAWGVVWWLGAGLRELDYFISYESGLAAKLVFFAFTSFAFSLLGKRLIWPVAKIPAMGLLPMMVLILAAQWLNVAHPFASPGYIGWLLSLSVGYWILWRHESEVSPSISQVFHVVSLWLLTFIAAWESAWVINYLVQGQGTWPLIAWALLPGFILGGLSVRGQRLRWPVAPHLQTYLGMAAMPLAIFLLLWSLVSNINSDGNPYPLVYLPLLNPLDLAQLFVFMVLAFWLLKIRQLNISLVENIPHNIFYVAMAGAIFIWLNAVLLRTLHYWADVPFRLHAMTHSLLVQASVSIFWSLLALVVMRYAAQKQQRKIWLAGSVLMAAVVIKLFTIDISGVGSLTRIVSFIGVAVLMLIMGYIAPLPARTVEKHDHV